MTADLKEKRKAHDTIYRQTTWETRLANGLYNSNNVIAAYKISFAMMYGLRIDFPAEQIKTASAVIPILVNFADAYGLLPAWNDKLLAVIFGRSCDGHDMIALQPLHFLRMACTLQSKAIYQEAMIHAVALYDTIYRNDTRTEDAK